MKKKIVEFGRYFSAENELREIEWIVLDEHYDGKRLLLSKNCIESMQYEYLENDNRKPRWRNCVVRSWLNNYFLNHFFTIKEKEHMFPIEIKTSSKSYLNDKIILLNADDVEKYIPNQDERVVNPTAWALRKKNGEKMKVYKKCCTWLLRDPSKIFKGNWTGVSPKGDIDLVGGDFYRSGMQGIRPAILVDI